MVKVSKYLFATYHSLSILFLHKYNIYMWSIRQGKQEIIINFQSTIEYLKVVEGIIELLEVD